MEKYGKKTAVFPGGYGRIEEIPHGRLWSDWGLKGLSVGKRGEKNTGKVIATNPPGSFRRVGVFR